MDASEPARKARTNHYPRLRESGRARSRLRVRAFGNPTGPSRHSTGMVARRRFREYALDKQVVDPPRLGLLAEHHPKAHILVILDERNERVYD